MILAIDAGNSRTKWGVFDAPGELKAHGVCLNAELAKTALPVAWRGCNRAVLSNVAGAAVAEALQVRLDALAIPVRWVTASASACGVKNNYAKPQQLGSDRWAALVAVWQHYRAPCIVVSAGTALTVDALGLGEERGQGIFLGGLIVPGFSLMRNSLVERTAGLSQLNGSLQDFPVNTGDAIYTGAVSVMAGAVASMLAKLQQHESQKPCCILSGGDAALLAEALQGTAIANQVVIADNLVLQGLLLIERENS